MGDERKALRAKVFVAFAPNDVLFESRVSVGTTLQKKDPSESASLVKSLRPKTARRKTPADVLSALQR